MMKPLTGRGVLLWLGAFFGLILATNAVFVTAAVKTFRGEDEQQPYLQGVEYNHTLARRAQQVDLGWRATVDGQRLASGEARIQVSLRGRDGGVQHGVRLVGELRHPADENRDRVLKFSEITPGLFVAQVEAAPGNWDVVLSNKGDLPFEARRRLWLH